MDDRKNALYRPEMRWVKSREAIKIPATFADNLSLILVSKALDPA
jgi:hypothetical protein